MLPLDIYIYRKVEEMIFETHGHYDDTQFDEDREQLIEEFLKKDIDKVMNVGSDMQSSRNSVERAGRYPQGMSRKNRSSDSMNWHRNWPCRSSYTAVMLHQTQWRY